MKIQLKNDYFAGKLLYLMLTDRGESENGREVFPFCRDKGHVCRFLFSHLIP